MSDQTGQQLAKDNRLKLSAPEMEARDSVASISAGSTLCKDVRNLLSDPLQGGSAAALPARITACG